MFARNWRFLVATVALLAIAGCSEPATGPATVQVTGTVTYNGDAVDGARVTFSPTGEGHAASGTTNASGKFTLMTSEAGDGAVVGSYGVAVTKTEGGEEPFVLPEGVEPGSDEAMDLAYKAHEAAQANPPKPVTDVLPAKYKDAATSELTADVAEGAANDFTFDLTD